MVSIHFNTSIIAQLQTISVPFNSSVGHETFAEIVELLQQKSITLAAAKRLLSAVYNGDARTPLQIVEHNGWQLTNDVAQLENNCRDVMEANQKSVRV